MRIINITPPAGYIICADYKYGQISKNPIDVTIGKNVYSGFGIKLEIDKLLLKISTKTKENLLSLINEGIIFEYGITFAVDRHGETAWSIPVFGQFENTPIIFWRKETMHPCGGQTLLYIHDQKFQYRHVKKVGFRAFVGLQKETENGQSIQLSTKIDKQKIAKSTKSIDELIDI